MKNFLGTTAICLAVCLIFAYFLFSPFAWLALIALSSLMACLIRTIVSQGDKADELEKRIEVLEKARADDAPRQPD